MKKFLSTYPKLVKEWHPTKNGELTPSDFTHGSNKKVWWLCPKGHEYYSVVSERTRKDKPSGCHYCSGKKVGEDNNLLVLFPDVAKEWHPTKNDDLTPQKVTSRTNKKVWWKCPKGHDYYSRIAGRTAKVKPNGCSQCAGKKVGEDNNLLVLFPDVAKEWHPNKNGDLTPKDFTPGSGKKVWWKCPKGHDYYSSIAGRTAKVKPNGCSECAGKKVGEDNNLLVLFPDVAKEWHPDKNGDLTPSNFTHGSNKKVWWLCPKGHDYDSVIKNRTKKEKPSGCHYCSGNKVGEDNNLLVLFPDISKEWHPTKNGELTPQDVTYGSNKKVWWKCPKGHDYDSGIKERTGKDSTGCPFCTNQSSQPEIRILSELKWFFDEVKSRYKIDGVEIDIFLPSFNLGIEYDGSYWHKDKEDSDLRKNKFLLSQNINLIRVRELPLQTLSDNDLVVDNVSLEKTDLDEILKKIYPFVEDRIKEKINDYVVKSSFVNQELFQVYRSYFPSPFPEHSLLTTHPLISSEWNYEKNYPLRPENFTLGSRNKVWWLCPKGHNYYSIIQNRAKKVRPTGCSECGRRQVREDNNLLVLFPDVAKEWHPNKNGDLTPKDFTPGSGKKVWWSCPKGHEYASVINDKTRKDKTNGCGECSGRKVGEDNNLLVLFPDVAKEWHPDKNSDLTPKDFTPGSNKKVWWLCPKGHDYELQIKGRAIQKRKGLPCPYCSGRKKVGKLVK